MAETKWNEQPVLTDHPVVCSILELRNFGENVPSVNTHTPWGDKNNHAGTIGEFKAHLRFCVEQHDKRYKDTREDCWTNKSVHRTAMIVAYTSDYQVVSESYLRELGFDSFGPVEKLKHPDSKLTLWFIQSPKFLENIKE